MNKLTAVCIVAIGLSVAPGVYAGDAAAGKEKSQSCVSCHGVNGRSNNPDNPNLAGQKKNYLITAIKAYKTGERKDPMMNTLVGGLSDADIENLAEFYSSVK